MSAQSVRSFDKSLYLKAAIDEALEAYGDFATMRVEGVAAGDTDEGAWRVAFSEVDEDFGAEMLASEFANFVLAKTIERKR